MAARIARGSSPLTRGKPWAAIVDAWNAGIIPAHAGKTTFDASRCSRIRDHPRSRGENFLAGGLGNVLLGSSPLPRGKRHRHVRGRLPGRLIPAHAGKTSANWLMALLSWAHPRSRGENFAAVWGTLRDWGSSPLAQGKPPGNGRRNRRGRAHPHSRGENTHTMREMTNELGSSPLTRGKPPPPASPAAPPGLIPTHAEKTSSLASSASSARAHPRSRGENCLAVCQSFQYTGSSPLTRGKPRPRATLRRQPGIIPAHAGKTNQSGPPLAQHRDHPRSRGENDDSLNEAIQEVGSSPLTRGKREPRPTLLHRDGIIPAHAGKTQRPAQPGARSRDHPRSRGENRSCCSRGRAMSGSSPLTRGKRSGLGGGADRAGIIPAHAGKTLRPWWRRGSRGDHPRSRGENKVEGLVGVADLGSSPLTRGKPDNRRLQVAGRGLIPAHAGKTDAIHRQ